MDVWWMQLWTLLLYAGIGVLMLIGASLAVSAVAFVVLHYIGFAPDRGEDHFDPY